MPKTADTRSHCKIWLRACKNLPQPPPYILFLGGCGRLLHALNHTLQWFLVSAVFGTVSSLHDFYIYVHVCCTADIVFILRDKPHPRLVREDNNLIFKPEIRLVKVCMTTFIYTRYILYLRRLYVEVLWRYRHSMTALSPFPLQKSLRTYHVTCIYIYIYMYTCIHTLYTCMYMYIYLVLCIYIPVYASHMDVGLSYLLDNRCIHNHYIHIHVKHACCCTYTHRAAHTATPLLIQRLSPQPL